MTFFPGFFRLSPNSKRTYQFESTGGVGPQGPPGLGLLNYTTTEQDTGRTWIDGKTIYQKTIVIAAGPNNSTVNVAHGITGLDTVVDYEMMLRSGNNRIFVPDVEATAVIQLHHLFDNTNIVLVSGTGGDWHTYSGHCTMYYTKT